MGQIVKQVGEGTTRYYWYPGDRRDWAWAGLAGAVGLAVGGLVMLVSRDSLISVTLGLSGKAARRAAIAHSGRAAWRAVVEGCGGAAAAVLIANLPPGGFVANWVLPMVPATVGALAHQAGMVFERLARAGMPEHLPRVPGSRLLTASSEQ